jgi:hypothetical protein
VIEPELEQFLTRLEGALHDLRRRERERVLREARDHVLCAADAGQPVPAAIEAFGAVEAIAAGYARPVRPRAERLGGALVAAVAVIALLAIAPPGGRFGSILISTSHAAESECAGRWNAEPATRGYGLAWVSTARPACEVVLHDATRARVFRQIDGSDRWHAIVLHGDPVWPLARVPGRVRDHAYVVGPDGLIGRRLSHG